jgi:tetratricopeptide (TPR) repeat protein
VFVGGWTLEAAEALSSVPETTHEVLSGLVDRSLVVADVSGPVLRYSMLETIRAFAARELVASGEYEETVLRHAEWFLALAESDEPRGPNQADWVRKLTAEQENLRAAIAQCLAVGATDMALRLGGQLGWWWFFGNRDEGRSILDQLLDTTAAEATRWRIASLHARVLLNFFGPTFRSTELAEEALEAALALGDGTAAAYSKVYVAQGGAHGQEGARALGLLDEAAASFAALGDDWGQGLASFQRMEVVAHTGHLREAIAEGERALSSFRHTGDPWAVSAALAHLARYRRLIGDDVAAAEVASEAFEVAAARDLPHTVQYVMTTQAYLLLRAGDHVGARRLFQEALEISKDVGNEVGVATNWDGVAEACLVAGEIEEALQYHRLAHEEYRRLGLAGGLAYSLARLGLAEETAGRWDDAAVHYREALEVATRTGDVLGIIPALEGLGREAARRRDPERAARLLATGTALRDRTGLATGPVEAGATEAARETTTGQLDSTVFTAITAQVASMDTTALVALVR